MPDVGFLRTHQGKRRAAVGVPRVRVFNPPLLLVLKKKKAMHPAYAV